MASIMYLIVIFILSSICKESLSVRFKVISTQSVVAALGSDVVLPCRLTPEMNVEKMEIRWFKPMYQPYVHLYIDGKDDYSIQMPQFTNRTELIKENITRGVFPLRIRNVTAQDSGQYYCFVESSDHHGRTIVQLNVTETGHPETCRDLYSRYVVLYPCLAFILLCCGFICFLLKRLGTKDEEIKQLRAALHESLNGISAAGISQNGWTSSDHVTYGNVPSVPLNGISSA